MTEREANEALADTELVPVLEGSLRDMKVLRDQCLAEDIPVALMAPRGKS